MHDIIWHLGSLYLTDISKWTSMLCKEDLLLNIVMSHYSARILKNFAYASTCLIASCRGILISTYLKPSRISAYEVSKILLFKHWGYDTADL